MKTLRYFYNLLIILVCTLIAINLVGCDFNTADISLGNIKIKCAKVSYTEGYYLSDDGVLYSPGADSDASAYVCYEDKKRGIVAENVAKFGTMISGGYCITNDNELYVWNRNKLQIFGYLKNKHLQKVSGNVVDAIVTPDRILYTDVFGDFYVAGIFGDVCIQFNNPMLLDSNVKCFCFYKSEIMWLSASGELIQYDPSNKVKKKSEFLKALDDNRTESKFKIQAFSDGGLILLENGILHFYGNYEKLIGAENSDKFSDIVLAKDIVDFSATAELIVAIDSYNRAYAWGKCLSNGMDNTTTPEYKYCNNELIQDNVKFVDVESGASMCFVDGNGKIRSFRDNDSWVFFGNSEKSKVVGINNKPVTWK